MHFMDTHLAPESVDSLKPEDWGFEQDDGKLMPSKSWITLERHWSVFCACEKCARSTCPCRMANVKCVKLCRCKKTSPDACKNPVAL